MSIAPSFAYGARRGHRLCLVAVLCGLILLAAVPWQMRWGVVPDTSWIVTVCEQVLAGKRLYVDVIETNPPFTIWLYLPPVALAQAIGVAPEALVHFYTYLLCVLGLGLAGLVAAKADFVENRGLLLLLPAFLAILVLLPGNSFSEREHLGTALLLPMLVIAAWRATLPARSAPSIMLACVAGIAGAVIVLVKPYYVLLILGPALYVTFRRRSLAVLFSPEYLVSAAIYLIYLVAVVALYPAFLRDVYPLLTETYMQVHRDPRIFLRYAVVLAVFLCLMRVSRSGSEPSPLVQVLAITSVLAYLPLFYQAKGWPYHAYPAIALGTGALLCRFFASERRPMAGVGGKVALLAFVIVAWIPYLPTQKPADDVVEAIRGAVIRPTIGIVGSAIETGHPLTRMVDGRWFSVHHSDWLGAFAVHLARQARSAGQIAEAARYEELAERQITAKLDELSAATPDILLVQIHETAWLDRLEARQAYRDFRARYRLLIERDGLAVYYRGPETPTTPIASPAVTSG